MHLSSSISIAFQHVHEGFWMYEWEYFFHVKTHTQERPRPWPRQRQHPCRVTHSVKHSFKLHYRMHLITSAVRARSFIVKSWTRWTCQDKQDKQNKINNILITKILINNIYLLITQTPSAMPRKMEQMWTKLSKKVFKPKNATPTENCVSRPQALVQSKKNSLKPKSSTSTQDRAWNCESSRSPLLWSQGHFNVA